MYTYGVKVFHRADGEHIARAVAQHLELYLLPAADISFDEYLGNGREHQTVVSNEPELLFVVGDAAAGTAQRVRGTDDDGIAAYSVCHLHALFDGVRDVRRNDGLTYLVHGLFEQFPVLCPVYRIDVYAYELDAVLIQKALLGKFAAKGETRLSAE